VNTGAPAAPLGVFDVDEGYALDRAKKCPRLSADPLPVCEVTGVLVHDANGPPGAPRMGLHDLADVADPGRECLGAISPQGIAALAVDAAERRSFRASRQRRGPADAAGQASGHPRETKARADVRETGRQSESPRTRDGIERGPRECSAVLAILQDLARALHDP